MEYRKSYPLFTRSIVAVVGLVVAIAIAYWPALHAPFLFDDDASILRNDTIKHLGDFLQVLSPPRAGQGVTGRPLVNLSLAINYAFGGTAVAGYHAFNILIHACSALLLFGLVGRTLRAQALEKRFGADADIIAWAVAAVWALHPIETESVTCIIQRTESLMGLFLLLTMYASVRSFSSGASKLWSAACVAACAAGMATKEVMVVAPLIVLLYDAFFWSAGIVTALKQRRSFYVGLASTWLVLAVMVVLIGGARGNAAGFGLGVPWWAYTLKQCEAILLYLKLCVWPCPLVLDYGTALVTHFSDVAVQAVILLFLLSATVFALFRRVAAGFLGAAFFLVLAPSSSVVPLITQTVAEHRMYLPSISVCVLLVISAYELAGRRAMIGCGVVALLFGVTTFARNELFTSEARIWADTVAKSPENARAQMDYANALLHVDRVAEAKTHYDIAIALNPRLFDAHSGLANAYLREERYQDAERECNIALALHPNDATANNNLAGVLNRTERPEAARQHALAALAELPDFPEAHVNLGLALFQLGRVSEAVDNFHIALREKPSFPDVHFALGTAYLAIGKLADAERELQDAIRLRPDYPDAEDALGTVYMRFGQVEKALPHYAAAARLKPAAAAFQSNYGAALLQAGETEAAIRQLRGAVATAPSNADAYTNLGAAYLAARKSADAVSQYRVAVKLAPSSADAHRNLAIGLQALGQTEEAEREFRTAVTLAPASAEAHAALGSFLVNSGRTQEGADELRRALALNPSLAAARQTLDQISRNAR